MKLTRRKLLKMGYEEWATNNFQKKITDEKGIKYYINCDKTTLSNMTMWTFTVQFHTEKGAVDVTLNQWFNEVNGKSYGTAFIEDVEEYYEKMWKVHGKPYYKRENTVLVSNTPET